MTNYFNPAPIASQPYYSPEVLLQNMQQQQAHAQSMWDLEHPKPVPEAAPSVYQVMADTGANYQQAQTLLGGYTDPTSGAYFPSDLWKQYMPANWQAQAADPTFAKNLTANSQGLALDLNGNPVGTDVLAGNTTPFQFHTAPQAGLQILPAFTGYQSNSYSNTPILPPNQDQHTGSMTGFDVIGSNGQPLGALDLSSKEALANQFINQYGGSQAALDTLAQQLGYQNWAGLDFAQMSSGLGVNSNRTLGNLSGYDPNYQQWVSQFGPNSTYDQVALQWMQNHPQTPYQPYVPANINAVYDPLKAQINQASQIATNAYNQFQLGGNFGGGVVPNNPQQNYNNTHIQPPQLQFQGANGFSGQFQNPISNQFNTYGLPSQQSFNPGQWGIPESSGLTPPAATGTTSTSNLPATTSADGSQSTSGAQATTPSFGNPTINSPATNNPSAPSFGSPTIQNPIQQGNPATQTAGNPAVSSNTGLPNTMPSGGWGMPWMNPTTQNMQNGAPGQQANGGLGGLGGWNTPQSGGQRGGNWGGPWDYRNQWAPT